MKEVLCPVCHNSFSPDPSSSEAECPDCFNRFQWRSGDEEPASTPPSKGPSGPRGKKVRPVRKVKKASPAPQEEAPPEEEEDGPGADIPYLPVKPKKRPAPPVEDRDDDDDDEEDEDDGWPPRFGDEDEDDDVDDDDDDDEEDEDDGWPPRFGVDDDDDGDDDDDHLPAVRPRRVRPVPVRRQPSPVRAVPKARRPSKQAYRPPPPPKEPFLTTWVGRAGLLLIIVFILGITNAVLTPTHVPLTDSGDDPISLSGGVYDHSNGSPIGNVTVELADYGSVVTDPQGHFYFQRVPQGDHEIRIKHGKFGTTKYKITISPEMNHFPLYLKEHTGEEVHDQSRDLVEDTTTIQYGSVVFALFSTCALVAGVSAIMRVRFHVAVIGAVLGVASYGFFIGSALAFLAFMIIVVHKADFGDDDDDDEDDDDEDDDDEDDDDEDHYHRPPRAHPPQASPAAPPAARPAEQPTAPADEESQCAVCSGRMIKGSPAVICKNCGAHYHRACSNALHICRICGEPLR